MSQKMVARLFRVIATAVAYRPAGVGNEQRPPCQRDLDELYDGLAEAGLMHGEPDEAEIRFYKGEDLA
jgi:hypothetical protein